MRGKYAVYSATPPRAIAKIFIGGKSLRQRTFELLTFWSPLSPLQCGVRSDGLKILVLRERARSCHLAPITNRADRAPTTRFVRTSLRSSEATLLRFALPSPCHRLVTTTMAGKHSHASSPTPFDRTNDGERFSHIFSQGS